MGPSATAIVTNDVLWGEMEGIIYRRYYLIEGNDDDILSGIPGKQPRRGKQDMVKSSQAALTAVLKSVI